MDRKDEILHLQSRFYTLNSIFMYSYLILAFLISLSKVEYKYTYCAIFLILALELLIDMGLSHFNYNGSIKLCRFVRIAEYITTMVYVCIPSLRAAWDNMFWIIGIVFSIEIYLCFSLDKFACQIGSTIANLVLLTGMHTLSYIFIDRSNVYFVYIITDVIYALVCFVVFIYVKKIMQNIENRLMAKDRILDKAHDDYENLTVVQNKLITLNEQLNNKRMELEVLYRRLSRSNNEMMIQYNIIKYISSTFEIKNIIDYTTESIKESMGVAFCCIVLEEKDSDGESRLLYSMNTYLGDNFKQGFVEEYLKDNRLSDRIKVKENVVRNRVQKDWSPFLSKYGVGSVLLCPINVSNEYGYFMVGSVSYDYFKDNLYFFETIVTQLDIAMAHASVYEQLKEAVNKDGLSKIYNRRYLNDYMRKTKEKLEIYNTVSIAIMDIDKFKGINDRYGHVNGDKIIVKCAGIAASVSQNDPDIITARYGGEEFAIIFRNKTKEFVMNSIKNVHKQIKETKTYCEDVNEYLTFDVSMGVAMYPYDCEDINNLLIYADRALYFSKNNGRGCITYYRNGKMVKDKNETY